jgi:GTP-binding protein EngB required for normal cell division
MTHEQQEHYAAAARALFVSSSGEIPCWLQAQSSSCAQRYEASGVSREFEQVLSQFSDQNQKPFEIFVVGEGNFGKSTLVNALLGQQISRVDFRPETRSFLRYILRRNPSDQCDVYARLFPGMHDYLRKALGTGEASDLFNTTRHRLTRNACDALLTSEADRCRNSVVDERYTPAIIEVERELAWTSSSLFPEGVRLVDTQGLNQIFDDDLLGKVSSADASSSTRLFEQWMAASPRGRHLDWQYRRCDAVVWLVSAQKPNPGATRAAIHYLSKYGKATILAITQVDRVQGGSAALEAVVKEVKRHFGSYARVVVPINGRQAIEASIGHSPADLELSGLNHLVTALNEVFLQDAALVRGKSQYVALKTTEDQLRSASIIKIEALRDIDKRIVSLRELIQNKAAEQKKAANKAVRSSCSAQLDSLQGRISSIRLIDDSSSAIDKLRTVDATAQIRNTVEARGILFDAALTGTLQILEEECFSLPGFDADGKASGTASSAAASVRLNSISMPKLELQLSITDRPWDALKLWALSKFPGSIGRDAKQRIETLDRERHKLIKKELCSAWADFEKKTIANLSEVVDQSYGSLFNALDEVVRQLEKAGGESLAATRRRLEAMLSTRSVKSPFVSVLSGALRRLVSSRFENKIL